MLEVVVLFIAGLGVYTLIKLKAKRRMQTLKINDVILKSVARRCIHRLYAWYVFIFAGHNAWWWIYRWAKARLGHRAVVLTYDIETVHKAMPFDFKRSPLLVFCWQQVRRLHRFSLMHRS